MNWTRIRLEFGYLGFVVICLLTVMYHLPTASSRGCLSQQHMAPRRTPYPAATVCCRCAVLSDKAVPRAARGTKAYALVPSTGWSFRLVWQAGPRAALPFPRSLASSSWPSFLEISLGFAGSQQANCKAHDVAPAACVLISRCLRWSRPVHLPFPTSIFLPHGELVQPPVVNVQRIRTSAFSLGLWHPRSIHCHPRCHGQCPFRCFSWHSYQHHHLHDESMWIYV